MGRGKQRSGRIEIRKEWKGRRIRKRGGAKLGETPAWGEAGGHSHRGASLNHRGAELWIRTRRRA